MEDRTFQIHCDAGENGQLHVKTDSLSVRIGQLIQRDGAAEMWDSVIVLCQRNDDGSLSAKLIVCHPESDRHLQIANILSPVQSPDDTSPALQIDLTPVRL